MSAGTLKLTNGSTAVTGTGTIFTVDLTAADFVIVTVGGTTYSLAVDTVTNATALVLSAPFTGPTTASVSWQAVPRKAMLRVTAELNKQVTEALRLGNENAMNWQAVLSANDTVTVVLPDGTTLTGLSWKKLSEIMGSLDINALTPLAAQIHTDAAQVAADKPVIVQAKTDAVAAKNAAAGSQTAAAGSATSAATSAATATTKAADAAKSAQEAANSAASTAYVTTPFPDVWAPLSDDLRLLAGNGAADSITISGTSYPLPSKSMTFTRASTATYVDKSGVLKTAAINEPRFEKEGLLLEAQGTNMVTNSNPIKGWNSSSSTGATVTAEGNEFARIAATTNISGLYNTSAGTLISGRTYTCSVWLKIISGQVRFGFEQVTNGVRIVKIDEAKDYVRLTVTCSPSNDTLGTIILYSSGGAAEFIVGRVQVEELPFATSYIPTDGASVTRTPDIVSVQESGNIPSGNDMSYSFEIVDWQSDQPRPMFMSGDRIGWVYQEPATKRIAIKLYNGAESNVGSGIADLASGVFGMSFNNSNATIKFLVNSVVFTSGAYVPAASITGVGIIYLGNQGASVGGGYANIMRRCHIRNFRLWHRTLSDIQMRGLR